MTKTTFGSSHTDDGPETPVADGISPPAQRDGNACDLHAAGHQMHYKHQGDAVHSTALKVRDVLQEGTLLTLALEDGRELLWRHHDPERLGRILEVLRGKCVVYQDFHALRVGPYWFNCAGEADDWQECRVSATARPM